jgi:hypothetical protein
MSHSPLAVGAGSRMGSPTRTSRKGTAASLRPHGSVAQDDATKAQAMIQAQKPKVPVAERKSDMLVHGRYENWLQIKVVEEPEAVPKFRWLWVEIYLGLTGNEAGVGGLQESSELRLFDESQEHVRQHRLEGTMRLRELEEELQKLLDDPYRGGAHHRTELLRVHDGQ